MNDKRPPFHLAFAIRSVREAREFYGELLGCPEGRSADTWIDFDFFGHQLALHVREEPAPDMGTTTVDNKPVPLPHFGVVLDMKSWRSLAERLQAARVEFLIEPYIRFEGEVGEQATMFFRDPSGNALEVKAFADLGGMFARQGTP
jgi:uncharacterized protein